MVGLSITAGAKVLLTLITSDPAVGHVLCGLDRDRVTIVIFLSLLNFSWSHFDDVSTRATDHCIVLLYDLHKDCFIDLILLFLLKVLVELKLLDLWSTFRALYRFVLGSQLNCFFFQAFDMNLMEAFSWLDHGHVAALHLSLSDQFVAEFAQLIFSILLNLLVVCLCPKSFALVHEIVHIHLLDLPLIVCIRRSKASRLSLWRISLGRWVDHIHIWIFFFFINLILSWLWNWLRKRYGLSLSKLLWYT